MYLSNLADLDEFMQLPLRVRDLAVRVICDALGKRREYHSHSMKQLLAETTDATNPAGPRHFPFPVARNLISGGYRSAADGPNRDADQGVRGDQA